MPGSRGLYRRAMTNETIDPGLPCPCGSGRTAGDCCIVEVPPLTRPKEGYDSLRSDASLVDSLGNSYPIPDGYSAELTLRKPIQLDPEVWPLLAQAVEDALEFKGPALAKTNFGHEVQNLDTAMHAVRYHQRQFIYRLRLLHGEHTSYFKPAQGNVTIYLEDFPLRFELEAFLLRIRVCLDVVARCLSVCLMASPRTFGELHKALRSKRSLDADLRNRVLQVFAANESWMDECSTLRHAITHEGSFSEFSSFGYKEEQLLEPLVKALAADHLCFRVWRSLLTLVGDSFRALKPSVSETKC
jgi:hypothetical protein